MPDTMSHIFYHLRNFTLVPDILFPSQSKKYGSQLDISAPSSSQIIISYQALTKYMSYSFFFPVTSLPLSLTSALIIDSYQAYLFAFIPLTPVSKYQLGKILFIYF